MPLPVQLEDVEKARRAIAGLVIKTPAVRSGSLGLAGAVPVFLKLENRQTTGSFKLRGASNAISSLAREAHARGVITASTGNHGRALAHAANHAGMPCTVCLSDLVPANKVHAIRAAGAVLHIAGHSQDEAQAEAERLAQEQGLIVIPPFDHPDIIAGQGTLVLEMLDDVPDIETIVVPLSGGGLVSGAAAAFKGRKPNGRVIGVSMRRGAAMAASLDAGKPVEVRELPTIADSLGGGINLNNSNTFRMVRALVDEVILLDEAEIAAGIRHIHEADGETVEGAGAIGIAALLAGKLNVSGSTAIVVSGGNIDTALHRQILLGNLPLQAGY